MDSHELKIRTKDFAHRCVKLCAALHGDPLSRHICSQLLRAGTSVAANYRAASLAHSKAAFVSKLSIVIEEVDESAFWMEFLLEEKIVTEKQIMPLLKEASELTSIFIAARKTIQVNNNK